jgi:NitT/TauT family transport system substrate-binding protein
MTRWLMPIAAVCALLTALTGFVSGAEKQILEKTRLTIGVGGQRLFYYLPLTIAERKGYFRDEGLHTEILDFGGGAKALQAMLGGSLDLVSGAYEHTINMQAKGWPVVAIVLQDRYNGIVLGIHKSKSPNYRSPRDLKGWKVGVTSPGSSTHMAVSNLMVKNGVDPKDVPVLGVGSSAGALAAVKNGMVDAIVNLDPVISKLEMDGDITVAVDTRTSEGMKEIYGGEYHAGCVYAPAAWIEKHPSTAQAVVNAMVRALVWLRTASVDDIVAAVPQDYYGPDIELYEVGLKKNRERFSLDGRFTLQRAQNVHNVLRQFIAEVREGNINLAETFDNRFVDSALKKFGR